MTEIESSYRPKAVINFRTSSTKGGTEAYEVTVENGVSEEEVMETIRLAILAREACKKEVDGPTLTEQLEQSIK